MIMPSDSGYLPLLHSRENYVEYLEGFSRSENGESLGGKPKRTRIKTYMLETARSDQVDPELGNLFPSAVALHRLDDTLYRVQDATHGGQVVGLIESLDARYPVLYTTLPANESNKWIGPGCRPQPLAGPALAVVAHPFRTLEGRTTRHTSPSLCTTWL